LSVTYPPLPVVISEYKNFIAVVTGKYIILRNFAINLFSCGFQYSAPRNNTDLRIGGRAAVFAAACSSPRLLMISTARFSWPLRSRAGPRHPPGWRRRNLPLLVRVAAYQLQYSVATMRNLNTIRQKRWMIYPMISCTRPCDAPYLGG
jgi:hypothetical protein